MKKKHKKHHKMSRHHIINRCNGGGNEISNLLLLRNKRHRALHKMFGCQTLVNIYTIIKETNFRLVMGSEENINDWFSLFGDKTKDEALALLERVIRAKEAQRSE